MTNGLEHLLEATRIASVTEDGPGRAVDALKAELTKEWNRMQLELRDLRHRADQLQGEVKEAKRECSQEKKRAFRYQELWQKACADISMYRGLLQLRDGEKPNEADVAALNVLALTGVHAPGALRVHGC